MDEEINGESGAVDAEASVLLENGEPVAAVVSLREGDEETSDNISEGESETIRLAQIEADTTVTVAAIHADVEQARIEAEKERVISWDDHERELEALRVSMTEQALRVTELEGLLSVALVSQSELTPTPPPEPEPEILEVETPPEQSLTPPSTAENETQTEPGLSVEAESPVADAGAIIQIPGRKRRRLI